MAINWGRALMTGTSGSLDSRRALAIAERLKQDAEARAQASKQLLAGEAHGRRMDLQDLSGSQAMSRLGVSERGRDTRAANTLEANAPVREASIAASNARTAAYNAPKAVTPRKPPTLKTIDLEGGEVGIFNPHTGAIERSGFFGKKDDKGGEGMSERDRLALERSVNKEFAELTRLWEEQRMFQYKTMNPGASTSVPPNLPAMDEATRAELYSKAIASAMARRELIGVGPSGGTSDLASGADFSEVDAELGLDY